MGRSCVGDFVPVFRKAGHIKWLTRGRWSRNRWVKRIVHGRFLASLNGQKSHRTLNLSHLPGVEDVLDVEISHGDGKTQKCEADNDFN